MAETTAGYSRHPPAHMQHRRLKAEVSITHQNGILADALVDCVRVILSLQAKGAVLHEVWVMVAQNE